VKSHCKGGSKIGLQQIRLYLELFKNNAGIYTHTENEKKIVGIQSATPILFLNHDNFLNLNNIK